MATCPKCGQELPDPSDPPVRLTPGQVAIYKAVRRAGREGVWAKALYDRLYSDAEDGGPLSAIKCLHVRIYHLNRMLRPAGEEVSARPNYPYVWRRIK